MNEYRYRPMQLVDVEDVHRLETSIFPTPWSAKTYRFEVESNLASEPWVAIFVEDEVEHVIGYIVPWVLVDEIHIANIAVDPEFRSKGIGRKLLLEALVRARKKGVINATLEVRSSNLSAQKLYRSFGFEGVGLRKRYYKDSGEDAIIMRLESLENIFLQSLLEDS